MSKCPKCGAPMESNVCDYCGYVQQAAPGAATSQRATNSSAARVTHFVVNVQPASPQVAVSPKSRWVALLICYLLGIFGGHYFYVGKTGMGILYLFTAGLFGVGWLVDLVRIAIGKFVDAKNLPLKK